MCSAVCRAVGRPRHSPLAGMFVEKKSRVRQDLGTDTAGMMSSNDWLKDSAIGSGSRQAGRVLTVLR